MENAAQVYTAHYTTRESPHGFLLERKGSPPLQVTLQPTCLLATVAGEEERFGLYEYAALAHWGAWNWARHWTPPPGGNRPAWRALRYWVGEQMWKAICRYMVLPWRQLLLQADPHVVAVQRAIFAATFGRANIAFSEALYRETYLVSDIIRYRAAAIAVRHVYDLGPVALQRCLVHSPPAVAFRELVCGQGLDVHFSFKPARAAATEKQLADDLWPFGDWHLPLHIELSHALTLLQDWRGLFSPTGTPYRSLNRTLMNLPGGISHRLVCQLADVQLQRPIVDRLELTVATLAIRQFRNTCNLLVFLSAHREEIQRALGLVAAHLHNIWSPNRTQDLAAFVRFVEDYPEEHRGHLVGLAEKSIRWHRHNQETARAEILNSLGPHTPAALPPLPVPEHPQVRFLATVKDICEEGEAMEHCIATYARSAVEGECYLFHVEQAGTIASIQVDQQGRVVQAYGPRNQQNRAARWGKRVLSQWGKGFPQPSELALRPSLPEEEGAAGWGDDLPF